MEFQSTPPVKAATTVVQKNTQWQKVSIHAAREGGDYHGFAPTQHGSVSIHAAREGGD